MNQHKAIGEVAGHVRVSIIPSAYLYHTFAHLVAIDKVASVEEAKKRSKVVATCLHSPY